MKGEACVQSVVSRDERSLEELILVLKGKEVENFLKAIPEANRIFLIGVNRATPSVVRVLSSLLQP